MIIVLLTVFEALSLILISKKDCFGIKIKQGSILPLLVLALLFAQMVMYRPGSDISPYAAYRGTLNHILILGRTYSAWISMIITLFCLIFLIKKSRETKVDFQLDLALSFLTFFGILNAVIGFGDITEAIKFFLPFLVFKVMKNTRIKITNKVYSAFLRLTNWIMILQVLLCKIITSHFAASKYYLELKEEYFGFFNHPHNYTGLLGMLCIWAIYNISRKKKVGEYGLLFITNFTLIYFSGSRSYVYALVIAVAFLLGNSLFDYRMKRIRKLTYFSILIILIFGKKLISKIGASRVTGAILSGRAERWYFDLQYYFQRFNWYNKLFGRGFNYITEVNYLIFGYRINSLNIIIDALIDTGVLGLVASTVAYYIVFKFFYKNGVKVFSKVTAIYFFVASCATSLITYQLATIYMIIMLFAMTIEITDDKLKERS